MFRDYPGFGGIGFALAFLFMMVLGFVIGLLFVVWGLARYRQFTKPPKFMWAAMLSGPAYFILLSLFFSVANAHVLNRFRMLLLLPVPASSVILIALAAIFARRNRQTIWTIGCSIMFVIYLHELGLIVNIPLPGL